MRSHIRYTFFFTSFCEADANALRQVQLQTLTAVVKLYLKKPDSSQGIVQRVLNTATKDCDSPDVRDRAYIYWRLLSTDPGAAKVGLSVFHLGRMLSDHFL
jgi:AP-1 complex subunit beta-1